MSGPRLSIRDAVSMTICIINVKRIQCHKMVEKLDCIIKNNDVISYVRLSFENRKIDLKLDVFTVLSFSLSIKSMKF